MQAKQYARIHSRSTRTQCEPSLSLLSVCVHFSWLGAWRAHRTRLVSHCQLRSRVHSALLAWQLWALRRRHVHEARKQTKRAANLRHLRDTWMGWRLQAALRWSQKRTQKR